MSVMKGVFALVVVATSIFSASESPAQVGSGVLLGTVRDQTGAQIPGVAINVTHEGTSLQREAVTNETGNYRVEPLQPGEYTVSAELPGFRREVRTHVGIDVAQQARIDFTLQVGEIAQVVEVVGSAPLVQTEDSQVGTVVERRKIVDLPLNGRNFSALAYITPGTFAPRPGSYLGYRGGFVAVGLREKTNQFLLDGINNNGGGTHEIAARVNLDAVAEFKVQTQNYGAQYGRFAGAQVDAIIKSGTNELHGTAFGFTRNDNLDARNFFERAKSEFRRHQYGVTAGGPIIRNKLFYFAGYQGQRQIKFRSTNPTVPRPEFFGGDLSKLGKLIRDPVTGQPFQGAIIPRERISPIALNFQPYWPVPRTDGVVRNAFSLLPEPDHFDQPNVKINYNVSPNHQMIGSWNYYNNSLLEWDIAGRPEVPGFMMDGKIQNWAVSFSDVLTISSNVINEFRAGYSRVGRIRYPEARDRNYAQEAGILGTSADTDPGAWGLPTINISGYARIGAPTTQPRKDGNWSIADTISIQKGNHALKFGGDYYRQYMTLLLLSSMSGNFTFTGGYTGDAIGDFLLGLPDTALRAPLLGPARIYVNRWSVNVFFQDDWKATNNLTLNIGLRYEPTGPMDERYGKLSSFDPTIDGGKGGIRTVGPGPRFDAAVQRYNQLFPSLSIVRGGPFYKTDLNNLAPRLGFAYRVGGGTRTVVRGGYGIFYSIDELCFCSYYTQAPMVLSERYTRADGPTLASPWPSGVRAVPGTINVAGVDPDYASGYYQHWNVGVQRELPGAVVVDVGYVGKKGTRLDRTRDINQPLDRSTRIRPYPLFGTVNWLETSGSSIYHGLQVRVERRSDEGLTTLVSYAWGKLLDDLGTPQDSYNLKAERGPGDEDIRHRLAISYVYPLPFGPARPFLQHLQGFAGGIFANWELSGIFRVNSGIPLTPVITQDISGTGNRRDRPNLVGNPEQSNPDAKGWWNRTAFTLPARGTFGNSGKGVVIGPHYFGLDASLLKRFNIDETKSLQFRFEIFNVFNRANFHQPNVQFDTPAFGTVGTAEDGRQIQFGLKYVF